MIRIAVCDDIKEELSEITEHIEAFAGSKDLTDTIDVTAYDSSSALMDDAGYGRGSDIYVLDILMPGSDGLETGRFIRKHQEKAVIIYLSSSDDFFSQAFDVYALQYQVKPIKREKFFEILDRAVSLFREQEDRYFFLSGKSGSVRIPFEHIIYGELSNRTLILHLKDGSSHQSGYIRQSFEKLMDPLLEDSRFIQPHKSFVINLSHVRRLEPGNFYMSDGSIIPVSRKRASEAKNSYMDFVFRTGSSAGKKV